MIGIIAKQTERSAVEEFFQLFKTPWEYYSPGRSYDVLIVTGTDVPEYNAKLLVHMPNEAEECQNFIAVGHEFVPLYQSSSARAVRQKRRHAGQTVVELAYNLWAEVEHLLSIGQPVEQAQVPTLDLHIEWLRREILDAGIDVLEIPPTPAGFSFLVALTHDIDFVGIRRHKFDHTAAGFLLRSTVGAARDFARGKLRLAKLMRIWKSVATLPLVYGGLAKDFWLPFEWYLEIEKGIPATYYLIPFKGVSGDNVTARQRRYRACAYDLEEISGWTRRLQNAGCEVAVHGIDAWHSVARGREELRRLQMATGSTSRGIRMHWLLQDANTPRVLEEAGYNYDSTVGYNETVGYRAGTMQVYLPFENRNLMELPMHIQDGALFFSERLGATEERAWELCHDLIQRAQTLGGVLTLLWHDRSHGPERFWGEFYARLVTHLRELNVWFASAEQAVQWFRQRRAVRFRRTDTGVTMEGCEDPVSPALCVRIHHGNGEQTHKDRVWDGCDDLEFCRSSGKVLPVEGAICA